MKLIARLFGKPAPATSNDRCRKVKCADRMSPNPSEEEEAQREAELREARERIQRINDELSIYIRNHHP
jgi:hypothetical protein